MTTIRRLFLYLASFIGMSVTLVGAFALIDLIVERSEGVPYYVPLLPENKFLIDLKAIPDEICKKAKILWINYPNSPSGAVALVVMMGWPSSLTSARQMALSGTRMPAVRRLVSMILGTSLEPSRMKV